MLFYLLAFVSAQAAELPPRVRFVPVAVKVTFHVASGLAVSDCAVELVGNPDPHWHDDPCRHVATASFLRLIGVDQRAEGRMTALLALEANGRSVDPGAVAGRLTFRSDAQFELRADGSIARCDVGEPLGTGGRMDLCQAAFPRRPDPFESSTNAQGPRRGRVSLGFYLDR